MCTIKYKNEDDTSVQCEVICTCQYENKIEARCDMCNSGKRQDVTA